MIDENPAGYLCQHAAWVDVGEDRQQMTPFDGVAGREYATPDYLELFMCWVHDDPRRGLAIGAGLVAVGFVARWLIKG